MSDTPTRVAEEIANHIVDDGRADIMHDDAKALLAAAAAGLGGSGAPTTKDTLTVTSDGQTAFSLSGTPTEPTAVQLVRNGQVLSETTHFTIAGANITYTVSSSPMATTDELIAYWR